MNDEKPILDFMGHDHDRLDELFQNFKKLKTQDLPEAIKNFSEFKKGLETHIEWEEQILFPFFEEKTGNKNGGPTFVMRQEHIEIKNYLAKILTSINKGQIDIKHLEDGIYNTLKSHNEKEENVLYPMIDNLSNQNERSKFYNEMDKLMK